MGACMGIEGDQRFPKTILLNGIGYGQFWLFCAGVNGHICCNQLCQVNDFHTATLLSRSFSAFILPQKPISVLLDCIFVRTRKTFVRQNYQSFLTFLQGILPHPPKFFCGTKKSPFSVDESW